MFCSCHCAFEQSALFAKVNSDAISEVFDFQVCLKVLCFYPLTPMFRGAQMKSFCAVFLNFILFSEYFSCYEILKNKKPVPLNTRLTSKMPASDDIKVGTKVEVTGKDWRGVVAFSGLTSFAAGKWVGVVLDQPNGKNNGSVQGKTYFSCQDNYGLFVRPTQLTILEEAPANVSSTPARSGTVYFLLTNISLFWV